MAKLDTIATKIGALMGEIEHTSATKSRAARSMLNEAVALTQRAMKRLDKGGKEKALDLIAEAECLLARAKKEAVAWEKARQRFAAVLRQQTGSKAKGK
jgi:hypothetical protein